MRGSVHTCTQTHTLFYPSMRFLLSSFSCGRWDQNAFHTPLMFYVFPQQTTDGTFHHFYLYIVSICDKDDNWLLLIPHDFKVPEVLKCVRCVGVRKTSEQTAGNMTIYRTYLTPRALWSCSYCRLEVSPPGGTAAPVQMCWCCWTAGWGLCNSASSGGSICMWAPACQTEENSGQCLHLLLGKCTGPVVFTLTDVLVVTIVTLHISNTSHYIKVKFRYLNIEYRKKYTYFSVLHYIFKISIYWSETFCKILDL